MRGAWALILVAAAGGCSKGQGPANSQASASTENLCVSSDTRNQLKSILLPSLDHLTSAYSEYVPADRISGALNAATVEFSQTTGTDLRDSANCNTTAVLKIDGIERYRRSFDYTVKKSLDDGGFIVEATVGQSPSYIATEVTKPLDDYVYLVKDRQESVDKFGPDGPSIPSIFFGKWCQSDTDNTVTISEHRLHFVDIDAKPMTISGWDQNARSILLILDLTNLDKSREVRLTLSEDGSALTMEEKAGEFTLARCE